MPSRVVQQYTREESPPSDGERSFVSAASENTSIRSNNKDPNTSQSAAVALLPSPPRHSPIAPTNLSPLATTNNNVVTNNSLEISAGLQACSPSSSTSPTLLALQHGSYFAPQPGASGCEPRSSQKRRPPASRSSNGIETFSGPPPALSTRRSYNAEPPWRSSAPSDPRAIHSPTVHSASIDSIVRQTHHIANDNIEPKTSEGGRSAERGKSSIVERRTIPMDVRHEVQSGSEEDRESTLRLNGRGVRNGRHARKESGQQQSQSSHEDLFLNLAKADSEINDEVEPPKKSDRKSSRNRGSSLQQPREYRPSSSHRPSTSVGGLGQRASPTQHNHYESSVNSSFRPSPEKKSLPSVRESKIRSYAASAHSLEQRHRSNNSRNLAGGSMQDGLAQDRSPALPLGNGRRPSLRELPPGAGGLGYKHSNLSHTPNGEYESSYFSGHQYHNREADEDPRTPHADGTESTVSTTAPSTVWDELEDMKSRIRKLEITGKLPASSNAAISNTFRERPPTATTTMTTNSLSPNHRQLKSVSPEASTVKTPEVANVHPLLHAALAKAKPAVNTNLYKALEATASDALTLAAMAGSASAQGVSPSAASTTGIASGIDRQLRRKADNMCRSLTELCIALAEETSETELLTGKGRPGSKDANAEAQKEPALQELRSFRDTSGEPEIRSSSRIMSRLEARRTSLALGSSPLSRRESPQEAPTPTQAVPPTSSRLDRMSSVIHHSGASEETGDITISSRRPLSRATTEIGQTRPSPQTRTSREYTSQHPMPNHLQRSPSVQSSLPTRKSYFPPTSQSLLTPNVQPGNRRYLDRSTPPSSSDSSRLAEARQRRIASLGQHTSAGQSRIGRLRQAEVEQ